MLASSHQSESKFVRLLACAGVGGLTVAYLVFHAQTHAPEDLRSAAEHLLQGRTHWITFQNRLLAPWLIEAFRAATGWSWLTAFYALIAACLASGAGLLLWRSWRDTGRSARGLWQVAAWFAFAFLLNHQWSYPWDYSGAFLCLLLAIWARDRFWSLGAVKSWWVAVLLLALALNRESSLYLLAALVVALLGHGFLEKQIGRTLKPAAGLALAGLVNLVGVLALRQAMFTATTRPPGSNGPEMASGNFNQVLHNWRVLTRHGDRPPEDWLAIALVVVLGSAGIVLAVRFFNALRTARPIPPGELFAHLWFGLSAFAVLLFADLSELRVFFELFPLWVILAFESRAWHPPAASD